MATKYWVGGGANTNWITAGNWSLTSGGAGGAAIPTTADDVIFNGVGVNANGTSTVSAAITVLSLTYTSGFTGTMVHSAVLSVSGNITFHNNYIITGSQAIGLLGASGTLTSNGRIWPNNINGAGGSTSVTKTLADNWTVGSFTANSNSTTLNGFQLTINSVLNLASGNMFGTTQVIHAGTSWIGNTTGTINNNLTINGNVLLGATTNYGTGTLIVNGNLDAITNNNTMNFSSSPTLNIEPVFLNNVIINGNQTITLLSILDSLNLTYNAANVVWAGVAGWTTQNFSNPSIGLSTTTLQEGITYEITNAFNCFSSRVGAIASFTSSGVSVKAILNLYKGASCNVMANFTRIDAGSASYGRTINTWNGIVTDCININRYTDLKTIAATF